MAGCFLDVSERDAGIERGGDGRMAQGVRPDPLPNPGSAGDTPDDPGGGVTVEPLTVDVEEERPFAAFADCEIDGTSGAWRERDDHGLAALAQDCEGAVATLEAERLHVGAGRFRNSKSIEREQLRSA
jgi:hypothetical protein